MSIRKISKTDILKIQVSSVTRNDKNFGKQNLFDECEETCWSSDEGKPQWILLNFKKSCCISGFNIQFQGGFVGQNCKVELMNNEETYSESFYPEDVNLMQKFTLLKPVECSQMKFLFEESTDFFGRVIIYCIDIFMT